MRGLVLAAALLLCFGVQAQEGAPQLPAGSDLGQTMPSQPRELFYSQLAGGQRSPQSVLGDLAFGSPFLLGGLARQEGISCDTCHRQGAGNPRLFVPGLSVRPGTFDTTSALFKPATNNHINDALTPPSLRGARFNAPYGHDGRFASLRDFARNVVVNEFDGPEPSPGILDALVAYMQDIALLPNPRLTTAGALSAAASTAERRGAALFRRPFPQNPGLSCSGCHVPSGMFSDHLTHDIGTGLYKTPTLRNANFNAPYFHDGRFDDYAQVVAYFDDTFSLGLSETDRHDLVAYLKAVGDGETPYETPTVALQLDEIRVFAGAMPRLIADRDWPALSFAINGLAHEVREFQDFYPEAADPNVSGGRSERAKARNALGMVILALRRMQAAAEVPDAGQTAMLCAAMRETIEAAAAPLQAAEAWSLFKPEVAAERVAAIARMDRAVAAAQARN